ncbi:hypothetical protein KUM39_12960 [Streptomyces sp. J2-1]|uniref:hypothetical protein n=1 Tax=Streptomyces corallincola TaxID=2851888 RepID=UPI001C380359|nr:hypothetical protein [Streptomyces corallincola]MBV2355270.1 hypothetical protein [Streptomyces corallincola]
MVNDHRPASHHPNPYGRMPEPEHPAPGARTAARSDAPYDGDGEHARHREYGGRETGGGPAAPGEPFVELSYISPQGTTHRVRARFEADRPRLVRPPALARRVHFADGRTYVQVRVAEEAGADRQAHALLQAEITAALALYRAYTGTRFLSLFPIPIGYDVNTPAPFVLYKVPIGRPMSGPSERLLLDEQRAVEGQLVLAVLLMDAVGLVHRGIVPGAVRRGAEGVQLWDLGSVVRTGQPRVPYGIPPYASPEQRAGEGLTDARDALWSVAQVMYQLVTGRQGSSDGPPADLAAQRSVQETLGMVFAKVAGERPTPQALLKALGPPGLVAEAAGVLPSDPLRQHRREFDEILRRKHASLTPEPPAHSPYFADLEHPADQNGFGPDGPRYGDGPPEQFTGYEYPPRERGRLRTWISGGRTSGTNEPGGSRPEGDTRR